MDYRLFDLKEDRQEDIFNDILFNIACAKADGCNLVRLDLINEDEKSFNKNVKAITRFLRELKKNDKIQLYLPANELSGASTESEYLNNMYPGLSVDADLLSKNGVFLIKL